MLCVSEREFGGSHRAVVLDSFAAKMAQISNVWPFEILGVILIVMAALMLGAVIANIERAANGGHNLRPLLLPAVLLVILGIGLLFQHRWAAVLVSVIAAVCGGWVAIGSLITVPMPWSLLNVLFGGVIFSPSVLVWRHWSKLRGLETNTLNEPCL